MPEGRVSSGRAVLLVLAVMVLLALVPAAMRGYLPGREPSQVVESRDSPVATGFVGVLLVVALAVMAAAVIARVRSGRPVAASTAGRPDWLRGRGRGRMSWRYPLIAFVLGAVWLVIVALLSQWSAPDELSAPPESPAQSTSAPEPDDEPVPGAAPAPKAADDGGESPLGYLTTATIVFLVLLTVGSLAAAGRRRAPVEPQPGGDADVDGDAPSPQSESLARAAEIGLAAVGDPSREPRTAIIACFAAMERELAAVPGAAPQEFDTASEVLARGVETGVLHADSAGQLVELFDEARFSPHVMDESHRDAAVRILEVVRDQLRSRV